MNLDDLHDSGGNALYRMNFSVTVAPGQDNSRQYGVAALELGAPCVKGEMIDNLYYDFMRYSVQATNAGLITSNQKPERSQPYQKEKNSNPTPTLTAGSFADLGRRTGYYRAEILDLGDLNKKMAKFLDKNQESKPGDGGPLELKDVYGEMELLIPVESNVDIAQLLFDEFKKRFKENPSKSLLGSFSYKYQTGSFGPAGGLRGYQSIADPGSSLAAENGMGQEEHKTSKKTDPKLWSMLALNFSAVASKIEVSDRYGDYNRRNLLEMLRFLEKIALANVHSTRISDEIVPPDFRQDIALAPGNGNCASGELRLKGDIYSYSASPTEQGQTVSTVANSARSLELALAAAAALPTSGLKVGADIGTVKNASALVEAYDRIPRVVGFADQKVVDRRNKDVIGWVFGPRARLDTRKNQLILEQTLSSYQTSIEVSVPGWWPAVETNVHTFFIGNLSDRSTFLTKQSSANPRRLDITIPTQSTDLEGLAQFVLGGGATTADVFRKPGIDELTPRSISVCAGETELSLVGRNLWRSVEVDIGGYKIENDIEVLPDMKGIRAKINVKGELLSNRGRGRILASSGTVRVPITVSTRDGKARDYLELRMPPNYDGTSYSCSGADLIIADNAAYENSVQKVIPQTVGNCEKETSFLLQMAGPVYFDGHFDDEEDRFEEYSPATLAGVTGKARNAGTGGSSVVKVVFEDGLADVPAGRHELAFIGAPDDYRFAYDDVDSLLTTQVEITNCGTAASQQVASASTFKSIEPQRVVQGQTIALLVKAPRKDLEALGDLSKVQIALRPFDSRTKGERYPWKPFTSREVSRSDASVSYVADINPTWSAWSQIGKMPEGQKMAIALVSVNPSEATKITGVVKDQSALDLFAYPSAQSAKAKVSKLTCEKGLPTGAVLGIPKHGFRAFPELSNFTAEEWTAKLTFKGAKKVYDVVTQKPGEGTDTTVPVSWGFEEGKQAELEAAIKAWEGEEANKDSDPKFDLNLSFQGENAVDGLPAVAPGTDLICPND